MRCKFTWKNAPKNTAAVISIAEITTEDEIPFKTGERLVAKYDKALGLIIMKPEVKF